MIDQRNQHDLALGAIPSRYRPQSNDVGEQHRKSSSILAIVWSFAAGSALAAGTASADCAPPDTDPPLCLSGTVTSRDYQSAIVELPGGSDLERLRPGDTVLDWKVVEIAAKYIVLDREGRQIRLGIAETASPPGPAKKTTPKQGPMRRARVPEERGDRAAER
ncbi:MAG: hypothetical protein JWM91_2616 [Rhodospirillales bacterium]|nr:hypothetical protein [Rhodospirillales bacterium]